MAAMNPWFYVRAFISERYPLQGVNPLSLAVSHVFKMEKSVPGGSVVLTESAYHVAWPTVARAYHGFERTGEVFLNGYRDPVQLYELQIHDALDLKRIVEEEHY